MVSISFFHFERGDLVVLSFAEDFSECFYLYIFQVEHALLKARLLKDKNNKGSRKPSVKLDLNNNNQKQDKSNQTQTKDTLRITEMELEELRIRLSSPKHLDNMKQALAEINRKFISQRLIWCQLNSPLQT